jgi:putative restriction endonuclease
MASPAENADRDARIRLASFCWLTAQVARQGDVLPWKVLLDGFVFDDQRVPLVSQQGIFKPRVMPELPLSIRTSSKGPYDDYFRQDDTLRYAYRGTDPLHPDNVRLRKAMHRQVPLVYFHGVVPGRYLAVWPVFVIGDDPGTLSFTVAADDEASSQQFLRGKPEAVAEPSADLARRRYITSTVRQRLHQTGFRERVLQAYREQCALCRLRHRELLEAAHIIPDNEPGGDPVVSNGLALCKLHHAAFDKYFIGIRPDYIVEVSPAILTEHDGPLLRFGLQQLHEQQVRVPRASHLKPDPDHLEWRYERFRRAG